MSLDILSNNLFGVSPTFFQCFQPPPMSRGVFLTLLDIFNIFLVLHNTPIVLAFTPLPPSKSQHPLTFSQCCPTSLAFSWHCSTLPLSWMPFQCPPMTSISIYIYIIFPRSFNILWMLFNMLGIFLSSLMSLGHYMVFPWCCLTTPHHPSMPS